MSDPSRFGHDHGAGLSAAMVLPVAAAGVCLAALFSLRVGTDALDAPMVSRWYVVIQAATVCTLLTGALRWSGAVSRSGTTVLLLASVAIVGVVSFLGPTAQYTTAQVLPLVAAIVIVAVLMSSSPFATDAVHRGQRVIQWGRTDVIGLKDEAPSVLRALHAAAAIRDGDFRDHGQAVANLAERLGKQLGMPPTETRALYWAALLHDVGKVGVERSVLRKPAKLNADEYSCVMRHPEIGADIIRSIGPDERYRSIALMVLHHHERWDGRGYPSGRRASEIPIGSRIIAVTDTYEALLSDRPYRAAMSHVEALKIVTDSAGSHFDPDIVSLFLQMLDEPNQVGGSHGAGDAILNEHRAVDAKRSTHSPPDRLPTRFAALNHLHTMTGS